MAEPTPTHLTPKTTETYFGTPAEGGGLKAVGEDAAFSKWSKEELMWVLAREQRRGGRQKSDETRTFHAIQKFRGMPEEEVKTALIKSLYETFEHDTDAEFTHKYARLKETLDLKKEETRQEIARVIPKGADAQTRQDYARRIRGGLEAAVEYYGEDKDVKGQSINRRLQYEGGDIGNPDDFRELANQHQGMYSVGGEEDAERHMKAALNASLLLTGREHTRLVLQAMPKNSAGTFDERTERLKTLPVSVIGEAVRHADDLFARQTQQELAAGDQFQQNSRSSMFDAKRSKQEEALDRAVVGKEQALFAKVEKNFTISTADLKLEESDLKGKELSEEVLDMLDHIKTVSSDLSVLNWRKYASSKSTADQDAKDVGLPDEESLRFINGIESLTEAALGKTRVARLYAPPLQRQYKNQLQRLKEDKYFLETVAKEDKDNTNANGYTLQERDDMLNYTKVALQDLERYKKDLKEKTKAFDEFREGKPDQARDYDTSAMALDEARNEVAKLKYQEAIFERRIKYANGQAEADLSATQADLKKKLAAAEALSETTEQGIVKQYPDFHKHATEIAMMEGAIRTTINQYDERIISYVNTVAYYKSRADMREKLAPYKKELGEVLQDEKTKRAPERVNAALLPELTQMLEQVSPAEAEQLVKRMESFQEVTKEFSTPYAAAMLEAVLRAKKQSTAEGFPTVLDENITRVNSRPANRNPVNYLRDATQDYLTLPENDVREAVAIARKKHQEGVESAAKDLNDIATKHFDDPNASLRALVKYFINNDDSMKSLGDAKSGSNLLELGEKGNPEAKQAAHIILSNERLVFAKILEEYSQGVGKDGARLRNFEKMQRAAAFSAALKTVGSDKDIDPKTFAEECRKQYAALSKKTADKKLELYDDIQLNVYKGDKVPCRPEDIVAYMEFIASKDFNPALLEKLQDERRAKECVAIDTTERAKLYREDAEDATDKNATKRREAQREMDERNEEIIKKKGAAIERKYLSDAVPSDIAAEYHALAAMAGKNPEASKRLLERTSQVLDVAKRYAHETEEEDLPKTIALRARDEPISGKQTAEVSLSEIRVLLNENKLTSDQFALAKAHAVQSYTERTIKAMVADDKGEGLKTLAAYETLYAALKSQENPEGEKFRKMLTEAATLKDVQGEVNTLLKNASFEEASAAMGTLEAVQAAKVKKEPAIEKPTQPAPNNEGKPGGKEPLSSLPFPEHLGDLVHAAMRPSEAPPVTSNAVAVAPQQDESTVSFPRVPLHKPSGPSLPDMA